MDSRFKPGDIVKHFKRDMMTPEELAANPTAYLYEIIGCAKHTETKEEVNLVNKFPICFDDKYS